VSGVRFGPADEALVTGIVMWVTSPLLASSSTARTPRPPRGHRLRRRGAGPDIPGVRGDGVCKALVAEGSPSRVLMPTAAGSVEDRVEGLGIGADDYLPKGWFSRREDERAPPRQRLPREAVPLARAGPPGARPCPAPTSRAAPVLRAAGVELDCSRRCAARDGYQSAQGQRGPADTGAPQQDRPAWRSRAPSMRQGLRRGRVAGDGTGWRPGCARLSTAKDRRRTCLHRNRLPHLSPRSYHRH
jgi:hypothetical protein